MSLFHNIGKIVLLVSACFEESGSSTFCLSCFHLDHAPKCVAYIGALVFANRFLIVECAALEW